jgi:hypothetical protein
MFRHGMTQQHQGTGMCGKHQRQTGDPSRHRAAVQG